MEIDTIPPKTTHLDPKSAINKVEFIFMTYRIMRNLGYDVSLLHVRREVHRNFTSSYVSPLDAAEFICAIIKAFDKENQ
jgi:hypothetical protein